VAIGSAVFGALVWGSVALVLAVFGYVLYAVAKGAGVLPGR
jgi:hypothetical protein